MFQAINYHIAKMHYIKRKVRFGFRFFSRMTREILDKLLLKFGDMKKYFNDIFVIYGTNNNLNTNLIFVFTLYRG